ncbi:inositol polyphosphate kinase, putative (IPK2) [Plasmodium malariae]|nr:inositol polyphosphate kinase, putative (IPK2) [Plasmodium malariae]
MGKRQRKIGASLEKRKRQVEKSFKTTSHSLGFRLCGCQHYNKLKDTLFYKDKYWGRNLSKENIPLAIRNWLWNGTLLYDELIPLLLEKLHRFFNCIVELRHYRFWSSSLLLVFDGGLNDKEARSNSLDIRMIDFANTIYLQDNPSVDDEYIFGLRNLIKSIQILNNSIHNIYFLPYEITTCFYSENYNIKEVGYHNHFRKSKSAIFERHAKKKKKKNLYVNLELLRNTERAGENYACGVTENGEGKNKNDENNANRKSSKHDAHSNDDKNSKSSKNNENNANSKSCKSNKNKKKISYSSEARSGSNSNWLTQKYANIFAEKKKKKKISNEHKYRNYSECAFRSQTRVSLCRGNNGWGIEGQSVNRTRPNRNNSRESSMCRSRSRSRSRRGNLHGSRFIHTNNDNACSSPLVKVSNDEDHYNGEEIYKNQVNAERSKSFKYSEKIRIQDRNNTNEKGTNKMMRTHLYNEETNNIYYEGLRDIITIKNLEEVNSNAEIYYYSSYKNKNRMKNVSNGGEHRKENSQIDQPYGGKINKEICNIEHRKCKNNIDIPITKRKDGHTQGNVKNKGNVLHNLLELNESRISDIRMNSSQLGYANMINSVEKDKENCVLTNNMNINNDGTKVDYGKGNRDDRSDTKKWMNNIFSEEWNNQNRQKSDKSILLPKRNIIKKEDIAVPFQQLSYDLIIQDIIFKTLKVTSNINRRVKTEVEDMLEISQPPWDNKNVITTHKSNNTYEILSKGGRTQKCKYTNYPDDANGSKNCCKHEHIYMNEGNYRSSCVNFQKKNLKICPNDNFNITHLDVYASEGPNIQEKKTIEDTNLHDQINNYKFFHKDTPKYLNNKEQHTNCTLNNILHDADIINDTTKHESGNKAERSRKKDSTNNLHLLNKNINLKLFINYVIRIEIEKKKRQEEEEERQQLLLDKNKINMKMKNMCTSHFSDSNKDTLELYKKMKKLKLQKSAISKALNSEEKLKKKKKKKIQGGLEVLEEEEEQTNHWNREKKEKKEDPTCKSIEHVLKNVHYNSDTNIIYNNRLRDDYEMANKMNRQNDNIYKRCTSCTDILLSIKKDKKEKKKKPKKNRKRLMRKINIFSRTKSNIIRANRWHSFFNNDRNNRSNRSNTNSRYSRKVSNCGNNNNYYYSNKMRTKLDLMEINKKALKSEWFYKLYDDFNVFSPHYQNSIMCLDDITNRNNILENYLKNKDVHYDCTRKNLIIPLAETNPYYKYLRRSLSEPNFYKFSRFRYVPNDMYDSKKMNYNNLIKNRLYKLSKVPIYNQIYGFTSNSGGTGSSDISLE